MCLELKVKDKSVILCYLNADIQGCLRRRESKSQCVNVSDGCDWQDSGRSLLNSFHISAASQQSYIFYLH